MCVPFSLNYYLDRLFLALKLWALIILRVLAAGNLLFYDVFPTILFPSKVKTSRMQLLDVKYVKDPKVNTCILEKKFLALQGSQIVYIKVL